MEERRQKKKNITIADLEEGITDQREDLDL